MDKDLAGQDAKELYDVSMRVCQSLQMVLLFNMIFNNYVFLLCELELLGK